MLTYIYICIYIYIYILVFPFSIPYWYSLLVNCPGGAIKSAHWEQAAIAARPSFCTSLDTFTHSMSGRVVSPDRGAKKNKTKLRNTNSGPMSIFGFYINFIKIGLMGWTWIDSALLNTFASCDFYLFFFALTFLGSLY